MLGSFAQTALITLVGAPKKSTYVERDIRSLINVKDISSFERFLKICATQVGQLISYTTIANDCGIDQKTVKAWISVLEASYIIMELKPHYQHF